MQSIYNLFIALYGGVISLVARSNQKAALLHKGQQEVFAKLERELDKEGGYTWFHAASLGEFEQGRPLMEALKKEHPEGKILLTFFSPSGYEVRKNYAGADVVCYLPLDTPKRVARFLDRVKPTQAIFIKYEFWANYLRALEERNVPTYLVSGIFAPNQHFFKGYGGFFRKMLRRFTHLYVQDERSAQLLASVGVTAVTVAGDTRFDRVLDIQRAARPLPLVEHFVGNHPTLILGSAWAPDEAVVLPYINQHPEVKLIIAPHEIDAAHLASIQGALTAPVVRYTEATEESLAEAQTLLIDCFGLLSSLYRYGQVAYIGGGFGVGIHNITEAAVYGMPVIFGTNYAKFKEAHDLLALGGAFSIDSQEAFAERLNQLFDKNDSSLLKERGEIAGNYIATHAGAAALILPELKQHIQ